MKSDKPSLSGRVMSAAEHALSAEGYVSPLDVLFRIRWLDESWEKRWRHGQIACLEEGIQTNPARLVEMLDLLRGWAERAGLQPSEAEYVARTPQRERLRFSHAGDPALETAYRTHWMSPALSEKKRARLAAEASKPPELVVIIPLHKDWKCHRCSETGDLLIMEAPGPACMGCAGLGDLVFLGSGNALLTRRARSKSARSAVVVRFSRTRKRYERQGLLVEPAALAAAEQELGIAPSEIV
ncbi:MAG TPA: hypothetical protein VMB73_03425 [Acetobacteraceae bacterium]|jgi:hypothetical protein|nr:hypothetical protein [Acetobacteraceae bacterium]